MMFLTKLQEIDDLNYTKFVLMVSYFFSTFYKIA